MSKASEPKLVLVRNKRVGEYVVHVRDDAGNVSFREIKHTSGENPMTLRSAVNLARSEGLDVRHWAEVEGDSPARAQPILF